MLTETTEKLEKLLYKIEKEIEAEEICMKQKLLHETEKMYSFNALGICLIKLGDIKDDAEYKEGLMKAKQYFKDITELDI